MKSFLLLQKNSLTKAQKVISLKTMTMNSTMNLDLTVTKNYQKKEYLGKKWRNRQKKKIEELQQEESEKIFLLLLSKREDLEGVDD